MLLKEKSQNITEVSELVGFTSIHYFSYAFKELYGVSPSEYKEKESSQ
jgi:AraC-like DNA-binding protein